MCLGVWRGAGCISRLNMACFSAWGGVHCSPVLVFILILKGNDPGWLWKSLCSHIFCILCNCCPIEETGERNLLHADVQWTPERVFISPEPPPFSLSLSLSSLLSVISFSESHICASIKTLTYLHDCPFICQDLGGGGVSFDGRKNTMEVIK